jgi:membrane-associated PAP2 superfamily phosphatase
MIGIIGLLIFNLYPQIDIICANYFFDININKFNLKNNWWLAKFIHVYVKYSIIIFIALCYIYFIYKKYNKKIILSSFGIISLIPLTISTLKKFSSHACPWDLEIYGSNTKLVAWWEYAPHIAGKCFPAGHASTGLCIMGISLIFYYRNNIKIARYFYIGGIIAGLILGISQQMRGAHFLSHTLASIYIACTITNIGIFLAKKYAPK